MEMMGGAREDVMDDASDEAEAAAGVDFFFPGTTAVSFLPFLRECLAFVSLLAAVGLDEELDFFVLPMMCLFE